MPDPRNLLIKDYTYNLPKHRIAQYPLEQRDKSKLLVYENGLIKQHTFSELADFIPENSLLIFNNTKVIQARLIFKKETGTEIEIFCLEPVSPSKDYQIIFQQKTFCIWNCLVGNRKKWKANKLIKIFNYKGKDYELVATEISRNNDISEIEFRWQPEELTFSKILELSGLTPLPPYINREATNPDKERYQTIYAQSKGSVAAPTAGLHFTDKTFKCLKQKHIESAYLTLHIGTGTFKPVSSPFINEHEMHIEQIEVNRNVIQKIMESSDHKIISVGTTTLRTLESIYWFGVKLIVDKNIKPSTEFQVEQWLPYEQKYNKNISVKDSLSAVIEFMDRRQMQTLTGSTQLMIVPDYKFRITKGIITNFHLPQSTLLLIIAALIGDGWKEVYEYALANNFRFLSYGDVCFFL